MLKHVTVYLVLCYLAFFPVNIRAQEAPVPDDVSYSIVDTDIVPGTKRGLDVRINKRVSEDVLRSIAHELKSQDSREFDRTLITYYLPDMEVGGGAWASTHFDPDLEVRILGLTKEEAERMTSEANDEGREIIGRWLDESLGASSRLALFREDGTLYMEQTFTDGSSRVMEVVEKESPQGRRFEKKDTNTSDYWLLDEEGNLQLRDDMGLIRTAVKIE